MAVQWRKSAVIQIPHVIQDIAIERRLMASDARRKARFCTLLLQAHAAAAATNESINRGIIPPKINTLRDTFAAVIALLLDRLSNGATDDSDRFFFCDLHTETHTMMTLCLLPNLSGYKRLGEPKATVEYDPLDLINFIQKNFVLLNLMMERAGMSEMDIYNRNCDVFLHFKLPYDQPPPEE